MRPLHIGYDILGHPNGVIPTPFLLPNLVSNHLAICLLFDHIGDAMTFVPPVGLGVDERTLDYEFLFVLLIRKLLIWLRIFVGLVVLGWHFEQVMVNPFSNFFTMSSRLS